MQTRRCSHLILAFSLATSSLLAAHSAAAGQIPVRYTEGIAHGFLVLRDTAGRTLAEGDSAQTAKDGVVTNRLTLQFKDGSLYQDTTAFSQRGTFRLLKDHVVQKGPTFKTQMESTIDMETGRVTVRYEKDGKKQEVNETMKLPADLGNGLAFTLIKNILSNPVTSVPYLVFTPKPMLVKLVFYRQDREKLKTGSKPRRGVHFVVKIDIGGFKGVIASLLNKKPPDTQMWVLDETVPTFVASEGPLTSDGPVWRIELVSPKPNALASESAAEPH